MTERHALDHLVYGVPDLAAGAGLVHELTGVEPVEGGRHERYGTANRLVGLGAGAYLEVIGPDPDSTLAPRWFDLARLRAPRLLTFALRTDDLDTSVADARAAGYDPGEPVAVSRRTADGGVLSWRLTPDTVAAGGAAPFLIDWGGSSAPGELLAPMLALASLTILTPDPMRTREVLDAMRAPEQIRVERHPTSGLRAELSTPDGPVTLE